MTATAPPLLQMRDVAFDYGSRAVLRGVSLTVEERSAMALIGPNGAGKTTLLRLASGALLPSAGEVLLRGAAARGMARKQRSRLVALVPQQLDVPFDFTVQQIVEQGRSPYLRALGGLRREDHAAVERAIGLTDLVGLRERIFNELSGGEKQRVKIALGLAQEPEILLLDEPTQNLDIGRQVELIDLLHTLRGEGVTVFASMHDLHLVPGNFDGVHLLAPGSDVTGPELISGTPADVLTPERLSQAFHCAPGRHPLLSMPRAQGSEVRA